jgi:hypothetical protein
VVAGQEDVLSTLGVPYSLKPITVYSEGSVHIVRSMHQHGIRRFIFVSSSATDPLDRFRDSGGSAFFEKVLKPFFIFTIGRTLYAGRYGADRTARDDQWP